MQALADFKLFESLNSIAGYMIRLLWAASWPLLLMFVLILLDRHWREARSSRKTSGDKTKGKFFRCRRRDYVNKTVRRVNLTTAMDGCRVLVETRLGRRFHRLEIAKANITENQDPERPVAVTLEIPDWFRGKLLRTIHERVPDKQLRDFEIVPGRPDVLRLNSVLYLWNDQSEDTKAWSRPPIIVSPKDLLSA